MKRPASSRANRTTTQCAAAPGSSATRRGGYDEPSPGFEPIAGHVAFYAGRMDACFVDGEQITPQPGRFYGGWITSAVVGPFKGRTGSRGW